MVVMFRLRTTLAATVSVGLLLGSCGTGEDAGDHGDGLSVVTAFYPLEYAAQQVVGDVEGVTITTLTSPGVEPHDLELTPRQVASMQDADLVIYSGGMQGAVDDAVASQSQDHSLDVTTVVDLHATGERGTDGDEAPDEDNDEHDHTGLDPHFWLEPHRYAAAADSIAEELADADPDNAETYRTNAAAFAADLDALDTEFAEGLAQCDQSTIITTHQAFGYLTDRYGLQQVAISGITPDAQPSPARIAEISKTVEDLRATAIYSEVLLGGALAQVIADETGAEVLTLDPIEGITDASAGQDYFEVMRANLESLRTGLHCR